MDFKKIIKVLVAAIVIPGGSFLIAYHGVKFGKKKYDDWKSKKDGTGAADISATTNEPAKKV